jgi:hypothetical protein
MTREQKREQIIEIFEKWQDYVIDPDVYNEITDAILVLYEQKESKGDLKDELIMFLKWYNKLSPADKCTVHPPAGSGGCHGLYNLTDAGLINNYLSKKAKI